MTYKNTGLRRVIMAGYYSYNGVVAAFKSEAAFRQELVLSIILIPLALWLDVAKLEKIAMIVTVLLVLIIELLNSAIESVVDRVGLEHHELAGRAKDMGSAAVLLGILVWAVVWGGILFLWPDIEAGN